MQGKSRETSGKFALEKLTDLVPQIRLFETMRARRSRYTIEFCWKANKDVEPRNLSPIAVVFT